MKTAGQVVIIAGLIGSGKSTLTEELAPLLGNNTLHLQEPDEREGANPYLADFYQDKCRWSFVMQVHLLGIRLQQHLHAQWHALNTGAYALLDSSYYSDTCFARLMHKTGEISDREFETYRILYQTMTASVLLPSVCVRLKVDPEVSAARIRGRAEARDGRKSELVIDLDYLTGLDHEINTTVNVLASQGVQVLEVDWSSHLNTPEERTVAIQEIANQILSLKPQDQLLKHHRRVI